MQDAGEGMSAFARAKELAARVIAARDGLAVEVRAPLDQLGNAQRAFRDERLGRGTVDEAVAGVDGIFEVQGDVFIAFHGHGDAALRVVGVRLAERLLGDDQNIAVTGELDGCAKAGNARTHDQEVDGGDFCHNL